MTIIETPRLILRIWKEEDKKPYFEINQDLKVIEFLPGTMTARQIDEFIIRVNAQQEKFGYTLWAIELKKTNQLIGFIGLNYTDWMNKTEIGWRIGSQYWGKGYATEGAKAAMKYGFNKCGLKEVVSFTVPMNERSINVMKKIGMTRDLNGDFNHPKLSIDHPLSKHVLYRKNNDNNLPT